jgi:hypothetical protein
MKKLLLATAGLALVATTAPVFVGQAQAAPKYGPCVTTYWKGVITIDDRYKQSWYDRYACWGWPWPYYRNHRPWDR